MTGGVGVASSLSSSAGGFELSASSGGGEVRLAPFAHDASAEEMSSLSESSLPPHALSVDPAHYSNLAPPTLTIPTTPHHHHQHGGIAAVHNNNPTSQTPPAHPWTIGWKVIAKMRDDSYREWTRQQLTRRGGPHTTRAGAAAAMRARDSADAHSPSCSRPCAIHSRSFTDEAEIVERRQQKPTAPWEYYIHFTDRECTTTERAVDAKRPHRSFVPATSHACAPLALWPSLSTHAQSIAAWTTGCTTTPFFLWARRSIPTSSTRTITRSP